MQLQQLKHAWQKCIYCHFEKLYSLASIFAFMMYETSYLWWLWILVIILFAIGTKHFVYVALSFWSTMSRTLFVISWFCFLAKKTISNIFFISTTNHNFLWIHNNNANAFSLLRNTSCLFHCSRHFISFSTFL